MYIFFSSSLRCRVRQPRAVKEEAFTASARFVTSRHLITGTYPRWTVHGGGGRRKAWRFYGYPFGACGYRRGRGTIGTVIQTRDVCFHEILHGYDLKYNIFVSPRSRKATN